MLNLLTPIDVGTIRIRNRIVMPAMHLLYTPEGEVTDQLVAFYAERARGGAGLIIVGGCTIDEYSGGSNMIGLHEDRFIPGLKRLVREVHDNGALIGAQLYHAGRYAHSALIGRQAIAPSALASRFTHEEPREMNKDDIARVIDNFARASARAKEAGFDLVEILGSAGYIISQFLSPITNRRTDEYGGGLENRMRFGLEVADAVRNAVGDDYTVFMRLAGNDFMPGGNTNKEARIFARELVGHGIDAFNVTGGWHETRVPQIPMEVPRGGFAYLAKGIKETVSKPIIACNRINDPMLAEEIISNGIADMVGFARGLIADPMMPKKLEQERSKEIMPCIGCNQGCFDHVFSLKPVECLVNPRAGSESSVPMHVKTGSRKHVMVIGGGPAGLSAAAEAARSGHKVTLYERTDKLGGQLHIAGALEERKEFITLAHALTAQAFATGVSIKTGVTVDSKILRDNEPDVVMIATGGRPVVPPIPGVDAQNVVQAWDVLSGRANVGKDILVIGGGAVGIETAIYLAKIGTVDAETLRFLFLYNAEDVDTLREISTRGVKNVRVIEMLERLGADIGFTTRWIELGMLRRHGVKAGTGTKAKEITPEGVVVEIQGREEFIPCDTVVLAVGTAPINSLKGSIEDMGIDIKVIGDAKKPRKAFDAIRDGFYAAREIS